MEFETIVKAAIVIVIVIALIVIFRQQVDKLVQAFLSLF